MRDEYHQVRGCEVSQFVVKPVVVESLENSGFSPLNKVRSSHICSSEDTGDSGEGSCSAGLFCS